MSRENHEESAFCMSDSCPQETNDVVFFNNPAFKAVWRMRRSNNTFQMLSLPSAFGEAPEIVRKDLIEWCRACAIADRLHHPHPKLPESVKEFRNRQEHPRADSRNDRNQSVSEGQE